METEPELADYKTLCYSSLVLCLIWGLFCIPPPPGLFLKPNPLKLPETTVPLEEGRVFSWKYFTPFSDRPLSSLSEESLPLFSLSFSLFLSTPSLSSSGSWDLVVGSIVCLKYSHQYLGVTQTQVVTLCWHTISNYIIMWFLSGEQEWPYISCGAV